MSYTSTDLTNVQAALIALATGTRKVSLSIGDKTITYAQADLDKLQALCDKIACEVNASAGVSFFVLSSTEKGL